MRNWIYLCLHCIHDESKNYITKEETLTLILVLPTLPPEKTLCGHCYNRAGCAALRSKQIFITSPACFEN